jgi:putative heme-binding domain-containing protein
LLGLKGGADALGAAVSEAPPSAVSARLALQWLGKVGRDDRVLVDALRDAAGIQATRIEFSPERVAEWVTGARADGNAERGHKLLRSPDLACLGCHRVGNEGGGSEGALLGPDLTAIGRAMTPEMIVESVFWPRRQVKEGFLLTLITTKSDRQYQGYKSAETNAELTLRDPSGGPDLVIRKSDISERTDVGTLMPEGLTDALTLEERRDLLRCLMELGR